jgi:hypothetical protein
VRGRSSVAPWILIGGGVAALAGGVGLWFARNAAVGDCTVLDDRIECADETQAVSARDASTLGTTSMIVGAVGIAATTAGVIWMLTRPRASSSATTDPRVSIMATGNSLGLGLGGAF